MIFILDVEAHLLNLRINYIIKKKVCTNFFGFYVFCFFLFLFFCLSSREGEDESRSPVSSLDWCGPSWSRKLEASLTLWNALHRFYGLNHVKAICLLFPAATLVFVLSPQKLSLHCFHLRNSRKGTRNISIKVDEPLVQDPVISHSCWCL